MRLTDGFGDSAGIAAGGDDCVPGDEGGLRYVDSHAAASASDEPNLLVSHLLRSFLLLAVVRARAINPDRGGKVRDW